MISHIKAVSLRFDFNFDQLFSSKMFEETITMINLAVSTMEFPDLAIPAVFYDPWMLCLYAFLSSLVFIMFTPYPWQFSLKLPLSTPRPRILLAHDNPPSPTRFTNFFENYRGDGASALQQVAGYTLPNGHILTICVGPITSQF